MEIIVKGDISQIPTDIYKIKHKLPLIDSIVIEVNPKYLDIIKSQCEYHIDITMNAHMERAKKIIKCNSDYTGKGVAIAFLDTGICQNSDFENRIIAFKDFVGGSEKIYDDNGHGTHICGIASGNGKYKGIAPKSNIVMLKTLDKEGSGCGGNVLAGIQWIYDNHQKYNIRIVNMSIGTEESIKKDPLVDAVEKLWDNNIVVVAAAGNNGPQPGTISSPGTSKKIITVGSYDDGDNKTLKRSYSGRGPTRECIIKPDILAPGSNIISCKCSNGQYKSLSGTSMSAPMVSGAIALLLEKYPSLKPDDVKYMLKLSAQNLNKSPNRQGWGLLNIEKLLNMEAVYVRK